MNKNYKVNLLIGFGVSLIILFISSLASYISIRNLLGSAELVNRTHQILLETEQISSGLKDAESGQRGYLLTGVGGYLEHHVAAQQRALNSLKKVQALTRDNPAQQALLAELEGVIKERFATLREVIGIKESSGIVSIEAMGKEKAHMDAARALIEKIKAHEQGLLVSHVGTMGIFVTYTPWVIVFSAVVALIIATLFYFRIRNDFGQRVQLQQELVRKDQEIFQRIDIIGEVADKISQGDYSIRIDEQPGDSLGGIASSLNSMGIELQASFGLLSDREWVKTGIASLNDVMIGEDSINKLSNNIINFITTYIDGQAGALYVLEQKSIKFYAGYAYVPDHARETFNWGEGLIGQSIATRKLLQLKDISPQNIYIKFTAGEASPSHIVAIPIYDGQLVKGGIEVASLAGFSERDMEFLNSCSHSIGTAISSAQNHRRLQELLDETQSQAEELQTQHRELENINSELEVQTEKLQASEEELKVQQEELRQANQELEERSRLLEDKNQLISERNMDIQIKAEQLEQSARYKSEFLANMSHELRTPLNSILLLSRLMYENGEQNLTADQVEYAQVIESSGKGLLTLIDEILDLSKIESGKMELEYTLVAVEELVRDMKSLFFPVAREKNLEFLTNVAPEVPQFIETDKLRLEQIIRNLLSNALKFTAQGYVSIAFVRDTRNDLMLNIKVKDTGIGIPKEKQQLIFDAFQQADGSTQRKYGGTGLGLSISRELIKLLGGEIHITSEVGQGSEFTIRLPMTKPALALAANELTVSRGPIERTIRGNELENENVERSLKLRAMDARSGEIPDRGKYISSTIPQGVADDRNEIVIGDKIILIVEDDINFAKSLLEYTRKQGYKGVVAVRGDEGLALAKTYRPLGILLDLQLPVKSGWEVMEELKSDPETRHIPVHIMSSHAVKRESLLKGAVDFIEKPFVFEKVPAIFEKIEYVLTHHPKKVLIVEENPQHAKALAYFLKSFDVKLKVSDDVNAAITALKQEDIHCVVLDMGIPDQGSYDTLEEVKKTPGLENLPVIVFTGKNLSRNEEARIKQYADSIVIKTAHSYQRVLDEVSLFLHLMEKNNLDEPRTKINRMNLLEDVLKDKTVLIADDDVRNIFSLTKALEKVKANVIAAVDGKDALNQLQNNPQIDIVLMDMMMPEMDGYESTAAIRRTPQYKDIPIIAVTAKAMMGDREKCINAGASDYITKPVDIDQLLSLLRVWLYERG